MDSMRAHITDASKEGVRKTNSIPGIIPGGMTKLSQPLDISVNKSFKGHIRQQWETWMVEGEHSYTPAGHMRRAIYLDVANWVDLA